MCNVKVINMKKFYLYTAATIQCFALSLDLNAEATASAPTTQGSLRKIFLVDLIHAQKAFDDATAFVSMSPSQKVLCFVNKDNLWGNGFISIMPTGPACQTIKKEGGAGYTETDLTKIKVPIATQYFNWVQGPTSNSENWYTPSGQPADIEFKNTGICTSLNSGEVGLAIKRGNGPNQCVFLSSPPVNIADASILVLEK